MSRCENCGERVYSLGCVNCNELAYIKQQDQLFDEEQNMPDNLWWGYRHTSGSVQAKRYFDDRASIQDAYESDFVREVIEPFPAESRDEALKIIAERTRVP